MMREREREREREGEIIYSRGIVSIRVSV